MPKVLLITSSDQHCGIAEYGWNLVRNMPDIEWTVVGHRYTNELELHATNFDVIHLNYQPGLFPELPWWFLYKTGRKVITLHNSHEGINKSELTDKFDSVVVHEKTLDMIADSNFHHVPMGISKPAPVAVSHLPNNCIGSAGFPFPYKGFQNIASAATILGLGCGLIMADSPHWNRDEVDHMCRINCPGVHIISEWLSESNVIASLQCCMVNVFAYSGEVAGISAAVRMGLASGQPIVLTRCRQFRDLFDYEDEIEFIESPDPLHIADGIRRVLANGKRPKRVLQDMSWARAAEMYREIYKRAAVTPMVIAASAKWVDDAISLEAEGKKEESLDVIFDNFDELLLAGKFPECDSVLSSIPISLMSNAQLLTVLTATASAKQHLQFRNSFFSRTKQAITLRGDDAKGLLVGLE